jgi:hypothetical protein
MAKKAGKTAGSRNRRSRTAYLPWPWPWPIWPLFPATRKQLEEGAKLARARGVFWKQSFETMAEVLEDWKNDIPKRS